MGVAIQHQGLSALLDKLVAEAVARDVPPEVAEMAASATRDGVRVPAGALSAQSRGRVEAYFSAVVRRRVVRRRAPRRAAAHFVIASVIEDLRSTGRSATDIWDELQRGWAAQVPGDVLEEYRLRLCG